MRTGINLASRPNRAAEVSPLLRWLPLVALAAASALHLHLALAARLDLAERKQSVAVQEAELQALVRAEAATRAGLDSEARRQELRRIAAFAHAGAADGFQPADVLAEIAGALPRTARAVALAIQVEKGRTSLNLEVAAEAPESASELTSRLDRSALFERAELVDERALPEGGYRFHVTAEIKPPRSVIPSPGGAR